MRSVKFLIAAGAVTLSTAAFAADLPIAAPPMYAPPPPADFGGWYLRGDIGMTNQRIKSLTNTDPNAAAFTSTGIGFVYQVCAFLPAIGLLAAFLPNMKANAE